jgi:hypothetical protein
VTPDRTTLIASTHRVYSMTEKTAVGDGQVDAQKLLNASRASAKRFRSSPDLATGLCAISTFDLPRLLHAHCQGSSLDGIRVKEDATAMALNVE